MRSNYIISTVYISMQMWINWMKLLSVHKWGIHIYERDMIELSNLSNVTSCSSGVRSPSSSCPKIHNKDSVIKLLLQCNLLIYLVHLKHWSFVCTSVYISLGLTWWTANEWHASDSPWHPMGRLSVADVVIWVTVRWVPARTLATDSLSFSAARRCTTWKLLSAAEKSFIRRSFWIFCWRCWTENRMCVNIFVTLSNSHRR